VPSYFTEIEKRAVLASAEIAGVKSTKIITEGVAIALEYINLKKT
jgi:molecular chaperone DnaK (HSP70)